ncbi:MAG TPA: cupin domain-containing protein [Anaerolineae bacterium]|jgi:mannose-6-phosphate isomerase-like protein (cupin superfamily)
MKYVFSTQQFKRYRFPTHINDLVMDRAEATSSEVFIVVLAPGEAPPLHRHDDTEQIFYILSGHGRLEIGDDGTEYPVNPGDVIRIPPSTWHRIHCLGDVPLRYLAIDCFPAGRPDAEPAWDDHVKTVCREQGWDYEQVYQGEKTE